MNIKQHIHLPEWKYIILCSIAALGCLVFLVTAQSADPVLVPGSWVILVSAIIMLILKLAVKQ